MVGSRTERLVAGVLVRLTSAVALAAVLLACEPSKTTPSQQGHSAPELSVLNLDDQVVKLADFSGKVVLVNFWLAECGPCLVEMPEFDEVYREHRSDGFEVLAVNMGQDADKIRNTGRRLDVSYPLLSDPLKITTKRYGVEAAPTSFLIGRNGVVRERINAPLTRAELEEKLAELL